MFLKDIISVRCARESDNAVKCFQNLQNSSSIEWFPMGLQMGHIDWHPHTCTWLMSDDYELCNMITGEIGC